MERCRPIRPLQQLNKKRSNWSVEPAATRSREPRKGMSVQAAADGPDGQIGSGARRPKITIWRSGALGPAADRARDRFEKPHQAHFLADKEGKANHDIPLWQGYCKAIGADAAGRRPLFTEMLRTDALYFLLDCAETPGFGSEGILDRYCRKLQTRQFQRVPGQLPEGVTRELLAAGLFIGGSTERGFTQQQTPFLPLQLALSAGRPQVRSPTPPQPLPSKPSCCAHG